MIKFLAIYTRKLFPLIRILLLLIMILSSARFCYSQTKSVPENIQAALLPKILKFNPTFDHKQKIRMLIVYDNFSQSSKNELIKELSVIMDTKAVLTPDLERNIADFDLVYFMPGLQKLASMCKEKGVLSVAGISEYVENGQVSLAFGVLNDKPKIYVNLTSLEKEGQSLSSEILRISKVYN